MYQAAPQASMGPTPGGNDYSSFVPDLTSFGDFLPSSTNTGQSVAGSSHDSLLRQNPRTNHCFASQAPPSLQPSTFDTVRHCPHCACHQAQMEAMNLKLQTILSHQERVEVALYQMQIQMQSTATKQDVQLSSIAQKIDTKYLEVLGSIAQIKRGMEKFFTQIAEHFSYGGEGASTDEDASELNHLSLVGCEQTASPATPQ